MNDDSGMRLFEVGGVDYDADSFSYLRVARNESELRDRLQREEDEDECSTQHYGLSFIRLQKLVDIKLV